MGKFLNQCDILFRKATTDYHAAQILYSRFSAGESELDLEIILFHLQQCAEKLLKAVLSKKEVNYPKVHDLEVLIDLLTDKGLNFQIDRDNLIELNDFAVEGRYSVIHDDIENIQKYFILLNDLITSTRILLKEE